VVLGGGDPVAIVKKYANRIKYIHLKDVTGSGMFCPLGQGKIDFPSIINILGKNVLYAIECDGWSGDPKEGARITAEYLKTKLNFS